MSQCRNILHPCDCMMKGWLKPACGPDEYRWAIDRLVEEFGEPSVRIGWETDYGRSRGFAVSSDWQTLYCTWKLIGDINPITKADGRYDLNDNRADLDVFIERARQKTRGFGT